MVKLYKFIYDDQLSPNLQTAEIKGSSLQQATITLQSRYPYYINIVHSFVSK